MIFGKTRQQQQEARETWTQAFAYCPVELWDGRWVFWQPYWTRFSKTPPGGGPGILMQPVTQNVHEPPEDRPPSSPRPPKK